MVDAYLRGYREALAAECDWILEIDAGFSHQPDDIPQFFDKMDEGYDCVFGSRFCNGGRIYDSSLKRNLISRGGTLLANLLLGTRLKDMTSGFEMFSRPALEGVLDRALYPMDRLSRRRSKLTAAILRLRKSHPIPGSQSQDR